MGRRADIVCGEFIVQCIELSTNYSVELRIHEHTERGDNEDTKKGGKGNGNTLEGKCCSA
jgi:hypothetical protein